MKHYVQLKDGVVFATLSTDKELETNDTIIEIGDNPEDYIHKGYDGSNFVDAEILRYAIVDNSKTVIEIKKTYFPSDIVKDDGVLINNDLVKVLWQWNGKHGAEKQFTPPIEVYDMPVVIENSPE